MLEIPIRIFVPDVILYASINQLLLIVASTYSTINLTMNIQGVGWSKEVR